MARPSVSRAWRAAVLSSGLRSIARMRERADARAASGSSLRDSARQSATRRAKSREMRSEGSAWPRSVIEIELKRQRPSGIAHDELVIRLHDRSGEQTGVQLGRRGLGQAIAFGGKLVRGERERDGDLALTLHLYELVAHRRRDAVLLLRDRGVAPG